ncbi:MAG: TlpA family protein disulfide reductase [Dehalococcoidia bacterium]
MLRALLILTALLLAACTGAPSPTPTVVQQLIFLQGFAELAAEETRFPFLLFDPSGERIEDAQVSVRFVRPSGEEAQEAQAVFRTMNLAEPHQHPDGTLHMHIEVRGIYVVDAVHFDVPGTWTAQLQVTLADGSGPLVLEQSLNVREQSSTPPLGSLVPPSQSPTARDVADLSEISTSNPPNPAFYQLSVAEALERERPFVVVFATPAFCVSRLCGPIVQIVAQLLPDYTDRVDFIHIEPYDLELLRSESRFQLVPASQEWGLPSEPFVFVVDAQGRLTAKFEGLFTPEELERAIQRALGS